MVEARDGGNRAGLLQRCADDLGWDTCEEAKGVCVSIQQKRCLLNLGITW
jgi:hypothetical protein